MTKIIKVEGRMQYYVNNERLIKNMTIEVIAQAGLDNNSLLYLLCKSSEGCEPLEV